MNIKGHKRIREQLTRSLEGGRTGHAYLFSGREGVGKRLVALEFSMALLETKEERDILRVFKGIHPDFREVEPERGLISIEKIREAQEWLSLAPMEGKRKVLLVNEAHTMNREAANAFLKSLEEPPPSSTIILITSRASQLLPTILSRCQILRFAPLTDREVKEILVEKGIDPSQAEEIVPMAQGSAGKALELALGKGKELLDYAQELYQGTLSPLSATEYRPWKREKEEVLKLLSFLRTMLKRDMERGEELPSIWERHKLLARVEENLYQYNLNPQLTLEYLELKWRTLG